MLAIVGCDWRNKSLGDILRNPEVATTTVEIENAPLRKPSSVVVCRAKQCAPANLSASREYVYNSLFHLLDNNGQKTALVCEADPLSRICTESYVNFPIKVGVTPAHIYIDSVKITDVALAKGNTRVQLVLNYNVTYNGQSPTCIPAQTLVYVKDANTIVWEDNGYNCKMNAIGQTTIKTLFSVDYIDLDYGFIGGYYSIGASGPSYGGGTGYMMIRLPSDAYPLNPTLQARGATKNKAKQDQYIKEFAPEVATGTSVGTNVKVFPIGK
jgi:hypothetical protein